MKLRLSVLATLCVAMLAYEANATIITKLSTGALYDAAGWNGGVLPTTADIGLFDSSTVPSAGGNTFSGSNFYIGGYQVTDIAGNLHINGSTTYIYHGGAVDMSAATADVYFDGTLRTNGPSSGASYATIVAPGRKLVLNNQTFSRNAYTMPINGGGTVLVNGVTDGGGANRVAYDVTGTGTTIGGTGTWEPSNTNGGYGVRMGVGTHVAPGASVGTTTFNGGHSGQVILTMLSGSDFLFELGTGGTFAAPSSDSDKLAFVSMAANDVGFNGNNIDFLGTGTPGVYKLFDTDLDSTTWTGLTLTGQMITGGLTFSNLAGSGSLIMGDGVTGDLGDIYLEVAGIPEPATLALGFLAVLGGLFVRKS